MDSPGNWRKTELLFISFGSLYRGLQPRDESREIKSQCYRIEKKSFIIPSSQAFQDQVFTRSCVMTVYMKTFTSAHVIRAGATTAAFCVILSKGIGRIEQKESLRIDPLFWGLSQSRAGVKNQPERSVSLL